MKKILSLILFLFLGNVIFSQEIVIQGILKNNENNDPVSFASVCVYNELKGISSNENGNFKLTLPDDYFNKKIAISSIGFNDTIIDIALLLDKKNIIKLRPKQYEIAEVVITAQKKKEIIVDKIRISPINQLSKPGQSDPCIDAKFFKYDKKYDGFFISEIGFLFDREYDYDLEPIFILRVMSVDTVTGKPSNDLIKKTVLKLERLEKAKYHYKYSYKLSEPIFFPKSGVFIGVEWIAIEKNSYEVYKHKSYAPALMSKGRKDIEPNFWEFYGGVWKLIKPYREMNAEPYIELKLTN